MGTFLQGYGAEEDRRNRAIKWIIFSFIALVILAIAAYLFFHNYPEKQAVKRFVTEVNDRQYQEAYRDWGCTGAHPCPNYDYNRFMEDWGPTKKVGSSWKIASVDGCKTFVTVNVQADGAELQSLAVDRENKSLGFAPSPECQERRWRWKAFFQRLIHGGSS